MLSKIEPQCERIVLGDFNICELHEQSHFLKEYRGILTENNMCQLIREPTRVTDRTATLLDHILVSREDVIQQSGVVPIGISDHELIYCTRKITHQRFGGHVTIRSRSLKQYSKDLLLERLNKTDWVPVLSCLDTNVAWQTFESCMKTIIDSLAPLKQRRIKSNSEPWVNAEILESIRERNASLHKFRKSKDARDYGEYRKHRNMVQCLVKKAKEGYIEDHHHSSSSLGSRCVPWLGEGLSMLSPNYPVLCFPLPYRVAPVFVQVVSPSLGWSPLSSFLVIWSPTGDTRGPSVVFEAVDMPCPGPFHFSYSVDYIYDFCPLPDPDVGLSVFVCDVEHTSFHFCLCGRKFVLCLFGQCPCLCTICHSWQHTGVVHLSL